MLAAALTAGPDALRAVSVEPRALVLTPAVPGSISPPLGAAGGLMVSPATHHRKTTASSLFGSCRRQAQQRGAAAHRKPVCREPGPPAHNDRGEDGAYRRARPQRSSTCWPFTTAPAFCWESVAGTVCRAAKSFLDLCWGRPTACVALRCSGPWAPTVRCCMRARWTPHQCGLRQHATWSHYAAVLASGADVLAFDGDAESQCWAVDGRGRWWTAIRFPFLWVGPAGTAHAGQPALVAT